MIEFDLRGGWRRAKRLDDDFKAREVPGVEREDLVYTILEETEYPEPVGTLVGWMPFKLPGRLHRLVWRLADMCAPGKYWLLADLVEEEIEEFTNGYVLGREPDLSYRWIGLSREALAQGREEIVYSGGPVLVSLPTGASLHISSGAGSGHMPGFHFIAVPPDSNSDRMLSKLLADPENYPEAIYNLIWDFDLVLDDSLFEVSPYGDEDRNYVEIVCSPTFTRSQIREVLRGVYNMRRFVTRATREQLLAGRISLYKLVEAAGL